MGVARELVMHIQRILLLGSLVCSCATSDSPVAIPYPDGDRGITPGTTAASNNGRFQIDLQFGLGQPGVEDDGQLYHYRDEANILPFNLAVDGALAGDHSSRIQIHADGVFQENVTVSYEPNSMSPDYHVIENIGYESAGAHTIQLTLESEEFSDTLPWKICVGE